MRYLVSYDLFNADADRYLAVGNVLEAMGAKRSLLSQWVIRVYLTDAQTIVEQVLPALLDGDRLLVACLDTADWAGRNLMVDPDAI